MDYVTPFITWLLQSKYIKNNKVFLNAVQAQDNNIQIITQQIPDNQVKRFIDGSKSYQINFSIANYKSVSYDQLIKTMLEGNENVEDIFDVTKIIDFVNEMEQNKNYPEFSTNITVEKVYCAYKSAPTPAIDTSLSTALAKYTIPIVFEVFEDA